MALHLTITSPDGEHTSIEKPAAIVVNTENLGDFDYALALIDEIAREQAYQWDGPQTMRVIAFIATEHLLAHAQHVDLSPSDFDAIREAVER